MTNFLETNDLTQNFFQALGEVLDDKRNQQSLYASRFSAENAKRDKEMWNAAIADKYGLAKFT